jgi:pyruvate,water dikinase
MLPALTQLLTGLDPSTPFFKHLLPIDVVNGHVYINMNAAMGAPGFKSFGMRALEAVDAAAVAVIRKLVADGVVRPRRIPRLGLWGTLGALAGVVRMLLRAASVRPRATLEALASVAARARGRGSIPAMTDEQLLEEAGLPGFDMSQALLPGTPAIAAFELADRLFAPWPKARRLLPAGIPDNPTTMISAGIDALIDEARPLALLFAEPLGTEELLDRLARDAAGRAWRQAFDRFLEENGHRGPGEFELAVPRWSDDPTMLLDLVRAGLASGRAEGARARLRRLHHERAEAIADAVARAPRWKRPLLRWAARAVERTMPLREAPKHYTFVILYRARLAALELGARMASRGQLERAEDVFLLEHAALTDYARSRMPDPARLEVIEKRREQQERYQREPPPDFVRSDGVPVQAHPAREDADECLRGTAVCGGLARGPVQVLAEPDPRRLSDGDVLVARFADPGWTPLFPAAAALVMEVGGLMCHAAVVARELGIPSVFGVPGATSELRDGWIVEVDGTAGTVRVVHGPGST